MTRTSLAWAAVLAIALGTVIGSASARDLAGMNADEVRLLQRRLIDAGCYKGATDGKASQALEAANKACPEQEPRLVIETGMHTASIRGIGANAACSLLATGSVDKTLRLWSLPGGELRRTIRLPIGAGNGGKIYAAALAPDGRTVAAGGWDATYETKGEMGLYLIDLASDRVRRIGGFETTILHIAFSPDGRFLAAALYDGGVRVLDVASGRELMADRDFASASLGVTFLPAGGLAATGDDGFVRLYGADWRRKAKVMAMQGYEPQHVTVSPDSRTIAVGYRGSPRISLFDASDLKLQRHIDNGDLASDRELSSVAFDRDGRLWAGGTVEDKSYKNLLRRFDRGGERVGSDLAVADNSIMSLAPCGGAVAFGAAEPSFGLIGANDRTLLQRRAVTADMRVKLGDAFRISADGRSVRFGLQVGDADPVVFDLAAGALAAAPQAAPGLAAPLIDGLPVADWKDNVKPTLAGAPLKLNQYETSRSLAIRPDRSGFVLGTGSSLRSFDARGEQKWRTPVPETAWGVNLAQEGRLVVAAHHDGTIRWYRGADGKELLALFVHAKDRRWVAWTPSGYYMASPGGEDLIGWHVNRGWEQQADFFPAARFRDRFSRPDIVQKVLLTLDEDTAVAEANAAARRKDAARPIEALLPPVIAIRAPAEASFSGDSVTLDYELRAPSGLAVTGIDVLVDGRPHGASRGLAPMASSAPAGSKPATASAPSLTPGMGRITIAGLPARNVEVSLLARAGEATSTPSRLTLAYKGKPEATPDALKPKLYVLAIGAADYQDASLKLGFAAKDALDFASAMKAQAGRLYGDVEVKSLVDKDAHKSAILDGLDWLERQVTSRDVAMVFLAGHGVTDEKGEFWYLPVDANQQQLRRSAVNQDEIRKTLRGLPSKAILFVDACHAGKAAGAVTRGTADMNTLVNELSASENGVVVFASAQGREVSKEHADWKNGAFTKAVVEGIAEGKADLLKKGSITLSLLDAYVVNRVKDLTGGTQHPVMTRPATITDFPIAAVK